VLILGLGQEDRICIIASLALYYLVLVLRPPWKLIFCVNSVALLYTLKVNSVMFKSLEYIDMLCVSVELKERKCAEKIMLQDLLS